MNSELIEKIEYLDGGASPLLATTRSFEEIVSKPV